MWGIIDSIQCCIGRDRRNKIDYVLAYLFCEEKEGYL